MPTARIVLWVATVAGLALMVRSVAMEPLPLWVSVAAMLAYTALAIAGSVAPRLEMFADVLWRGDEGRKCVALTIDVGAEPASARSLIAVLDAHEVPATFFVRGDAAVRYEHLLSDMRSAGHQLALGPFRDERGYAWLPPARVAADIERTRDAVARAADLQPEQLRFFRPPGRSVSARTGAGARRSGVHIVWWSLSISGAGPQPERYEQRLIPGAIIRLAGTGAKRVDVHQLETLLERIDARGLQPTTLDELLLERE